jgi:hypothetical protein
MASPHLDAGSENRWLSQGQAFGKRNTAVRLPCKSRKAHTGQWDWAILSSIRRPQTSIADARSDVTNRAAVGDYAFLRGISCDAAR